MIDTSVVAYADSDDNLEDILLDPISKNIYDDIVQIYNSLDITNQEDAYYNLLEKYNKHYLIYYFMGYYFNKIGNIELAISCYKICISKYPLIDAFLNLSIIFQQYGKMDNVKKLLNIAIQHKPTDLRILNFIGAIYYLEKDYYVAIEHYKKIIAEHPTPNNSLKNIHNNLGFSCSAIGKCEMALNYFESGLQIQCHETPENIKLNVQLLQNKLINYDYMYVLPRNIFSDYLRINSILKTVTVCNRPNSKSNKIRIGYISPDLRQHVCAYFIVPILKNQSRELFTIYCYANVRHEDGVSHIIKKMPQMNWYNIYDKSTVDVCNLIIKHQIDILIDLAGHTNGNRMDVMSQRPAPIQMTYLGYPNTTGLVSIDYRITDKYADPATTKQQYTEKLICMPRCFLCYSISPLLGSIPIQISTHTNITFGVMNKLNKHNKETFRAWSEIIKRVPNSVLLIKRDMKTAFDIKIKYLKKMGLASEQIQVVNFIPNEKDYLELYNTIDICLDTFPYSGTTTSCDAFQMSTPIVTLAMADRHVSNVTKSILLNMEFTELIADTIDGYIDIAVKLANDPNKIIYYKKNIRPKFVELMDEVKFTKEFDNLIYSTYINHGV